MILGRNWNENHRLDDSKALKVKEREELYEIICKEALAVSTVSMSAELVDRLNVLHARPFVRDSDQPRWNILSLMRAALPRLYLR